MGQDVHDRRAKVVSTAYADMGFDVAMSSLAAGHKTLLPALVAALKERGRDDILVVAGGVIPAQDYDFLYAQGAQAIFGPGTVITTSAAKLMDVLETQFGHRDG